MFLLTTLLTGWEGMSVASADGCDSLRLQLSALEGEKRVAAFEQLYYCSMEEGSFDEQLQCVDDYIREARRQHMTEEEAFAMAQKGTLFYNNDMNDSVFDAFPSMMERMRVLENKTHLYELWSQLAYTYIYTNQNTLGLRETQAMYADAKAAADVFGMGLAYSIMGTAYANLRNFDESVDAFRKSIAMLSSLTPLPPVLPDVYTYYGNALNDMQDYVRLEQLLADWHTMLQTFIEAHNIDDSSAADIYWSYYYCACVQAKLGQGKLAEAETYIDESRQHIRELDSYSGLQWLYFMAQLKLMQGSYPEALDYNAQRLQLLEQNSDKSDLVKVLQQRAEILQQLGRYQEATDLYREVYHINDSLNSQDTKDKLNEMNTMYRLDEKQMENERLQMRNERNLFWFIIVVITVAILSLTVFLFFRIRAARKLKQAHTQLQTAYGELKEANEVIEQTTAAKERIESELRIARDIQMSMVPTLFPERADLDLFASMTPAKEVGGDLYNFFLTGDDGGTDDAKLYFALGDVSGKGVPASLFMAQATRLFRTMAKQQLPPAEIATRMNDELGEDNEQGMFVTMFIGLLDLNTGHLDFCNAGHNPPVLMSAGEEVATPRFLEMESNAPIGLWPGLEYVGEQIDDIRQQPLLVYTDGLNEAENREQEQFGDERLLQLLGDTPFVSSQQTLAMLGAEVEKHRDGAEPNDDLTMMCVMLKGKQS